VTEEASRGEVFTVLSKYAFSVRFVSFVAFVSSRLVSFV